MSLRHALKDHAWDAPVARDTLQRGVADLLPTLPDDGL